MEHMTFKQKYQFYLEEQPSVTYGASLFVIGLILGSIFYIVHLYTGFGLGLAAVLYNFAIIGGLVVLGSLLQTEKMQARYMILLNPFISTYRRKDYRSFILYILAVATLFVLILTILTYLTSINFLQQTIIAIVVAANLIMASVGLTLTTRVRKFSNFAQSEFLVVGIYVSIFLEQIFFDRVFFLEWFFFELILAFVVTGLVGVLSEVLIFGPLTKRQATPLSLMVASIGLGLILRQTIQEMFGSVPRTSAPNYPGFFDTIGDSIGKVSDRIPVLGQYLNFFAAPFSENVVIRLPRIIQTIRLSRDEFWTVIVMVLTIAILQYIFTKTTLGISMRATADDDDLAQITGINTRRVILWTWFIAAGVTGMGAIYFFEATQIQPGSGFVQLLLIFAVVILGGYDSFEGTVISAFIISFSMSIAVILNGRLGAIEDSNELIDKMVFWSTSGDWKFAVAFAIIIVVLIFRPRGIFGLIDPQAKL